MLEERDERKVVSADYKTRRRRARAESSPSRLEPAVEDLLDPLEDSSRVLLRGDGDVVNVVSVDLGDVVSSGELSKLGDGRDADDLRRAKPRVSFRRLKMVRRLDASSC